MLNYHDNNYTQLFSFSECSDAFHKESKTVQTEHFADSNEQQDSLSDSDPISIGNPESSDVPMPGQLKATDSLLLLNQLGLDNTIISMRAFSLRKTILSSHTQCLSVLS